MDGISDIVFKEYIKVGDISTITCLSCNKSLLDICTDNNTDIHNKIQVECISCKRKTFIYDIHGKMFISPNGKNEILEITDNLFRVQTW